MVRSAGQSEWAKHLQDVQSGMTNNACLLGPPRIYGESAAALRARMIKVSLCNDAESFCWTTYASQYHINQTPQGSQGSINIVIVLSDGYLHHCLTRRIDRNNRNGNETFTEQADFAVLRSCVCPAKPRQDVLGPGPNLGQSAYKLYWGF